ncbi:MAG: cyclase family protein [Candidatus Lambdaproteobacteria bacterium]|nr:cyclase family protein [Candidatus Lambdaproteobacteria bacterium]
MAGALIRYDLSLPTFFTYAPAPLVATRTMIPRQERRQIYIRGEYGTKPDGGMRPLSAHATTHLDAPHHFLADGADVAALLNRPETPADRPALARIVHLHGRPHLPAARTREGIAYCEAVSADLLPPARVLRRYEALVVLTGFGSVMAREREGQLAPDADGANHLPYFTADAVAHILASGLRLVALDSTTVEPQTSLAPLRYGSDVHFDLLGAEPPVLIVEGIGGGDLVTQTGLTPAEALLHVVPRRANARGADAAPSRVFLYFYRDDPAGRALRRLARALTPEELYG